jgi:hypothetical protein
MIYLISQSMFSFIVTVNPPLMCCNWYKCLFLLSFPLLWGE